MTCRLGIDIGGTFTDFVLLEENADAVAIHKRLTTPSDPSVAVLEGVRELLGKHQVPMERLTEVVHGTTLVTNAIIERKGAVTGLLVTAGFRDILDMRFEQRYDLYDLRLQFPKPLVPRHLRREVVERIRYDGSIERALDLGLARQAIRELVDSHRIEALAVCLIHSYANSVHEESIRELARDEFPKLYVSTSAEIAPNMREFERWTTSCINAYTQPMFDRYVARLEDGLTTQGFRGRLYIMTSSGGTVTPETARRFPVRMLESGPAAGVLMSAFLGHMLDLPNLLAFDMGGTTAKGALILGKSPIKKYAMELARVHEFKRGSGLPVRIPVLDMIEIGAGGGSIAEVDERRLIRVGPRSAGADPGPACYGRGGAFATLTDANLVLGYLNPDYFLGGEMTLDQPASERAIRSNVADKLDLDLARAAWGMHEIINEDVARAFRIHASERGFDYRNCSVVAFGGGGPIHALAIARKLKIPRVVFPLGAGVMSAFGLLVSPLSFEVSKSNRIFLDALDPPRFANTFEPLVSQASDFLRRAGVTPADMRVTRRLDMRYRGQGYEIEVTLPENFDLVAAFAQLPSLFARRYKQIFSLSFLNEPLEIVNWKVEVTAPARSFRYGRGLTEKRLARREVPPAGKALKGMRQAYFDQVDGYMDCAVYDRYALTLGTRIEGPALVEERESTCVIGMGDVAEVDAHHNLIASPTR